MLTPIPSSTGSYSFSASSSSKASSGSSSVSSTEPAVEQVDKEIAARVEAMRDALQEIRSGSLAVERQVGEQWTIQIAGIQRKNFPEIYVTGSMETYFSGPDFATLVDFAERQLASDITKNKGVDMGKSAPLDKIDSFKSVSSLLSAPTTLDARTKERLRLLDLALNEIAGDAESVTCSTEDGWAITRIIIKPFFGGGRTISVSGAIEEWGFQGPDFEKMIANARKKLRNEVIESSARDAMQAKRKEYDDHKAKETTVKRKLETQAARM